MVQPETDTFDDDANRRAPHRAVQQPCLFVALECDRPTTPGCRCGLANIDQVLIGRGSERSITRRLVGGLRTLTVRVPGRSMSAMHARIIRSERGWVLQDTGSTNGSSVGGRRINSAVLSDGDVLELGHTIFIVASTMVPSGSPDDYDPSREQELPPGLMTLVPQLHADFQDLARVARSNIPVLISGETGTGKEFVARSVHQLSQRNGALVPVNCGAIAPNLVEAQLFGHVRGAFTGAERDERGLVRAASGGTLLLDEIGDLPLLAQPALLRVLQEQEVTPLGSTRAIRVDLRIVAATHRPLDVLSRSAQFRPDLLARLNSYRFDLPPLRRRLVDIGCILAQCSHRRNEPFQLSPEAGVALAKETWPGNIRELVNVIQRGAVLAEGRLVEVQHLGLPSNSPSTSTAECQTLAEKPARQRERELREELLAQLSNSRGNIAAVARRMGKARTQIHRWVKRFGIEVTTFRSPGDDVT